MKNADNYAEYSLPQDAIRNFVLRAQSTNESQKFIQEVRSSFLWKMVCENRDLGIDV
jgi:hypothetical protein